jgi:antitoxin YefM
VGSRADSTACTALPRLADLTPGSERAAVQWIPDRECATIVVMTVEPLRTVRDHLSEFVDRVEGQHERIVLTRNGRAAAVLISPEDLAQLEETIDVLSDPAALADIREADEAYARGDVVRGVEAIRQLRP